MATIKAAITRSLRWGGDVLTYLLPYRGHQTRHIRVPKTGRPAKAEKREGGDFLLHRCCSFHVNVVILPPYGVEGP